MDKSLDIKSLTTDQQTDLRKLLSIFFLGQLLGLPTLNSILGFHSIKSNQHQIDYKKICKSLTNREIHKIFSSIFEKVLTEKLTELSKKDSSIWSKQLVTVVVDDSIFRTWLESSSEQIKDYENYYSKWFSGQFYSSVYGYKVVSLGIVIDGVFYPLYFELVKKSKEDSAIKVAQGLVEKVGIFLENLRKKGCQIPTISLSCDNGYNSTALSETCQKANLLYISVPKKTEKIQVNGTTYKIKEYIEKVFLVNEENYLKEIQKKSKQEPEKAIEPNQQAKSPPFSQRIRANYCAKNQEVTLLFFRFNGSNKVSVIYCPDKNIFAKTLRHNWFQRTQIDWASPNNSSDYSNILYK